MWRASESTPGAPRVSLTAHGQGVSERVRRFAETAVLPPHQCNDLVLAGRLHDLGKADPRFQAWLEGGDAWRPAAHGLLADSPRAPATPAARLLANERSGYPPDARHELLSTTLAASAPHCLAQAHDPDLMPFLIASHHGRCRPFAPVVDDPAPLTVVVNAFSHTLQASSAHRLERLDSGVPERFWRLVRRYGWCGLPYLEALLCLADGLPSGRLP